MCRGALLSWSIGPGWRTTCDSIFWRFWTALNCFEHVLRWWIWRHGISRDRTGRRGSESEALTDSNIERTIWRCRCFLSFSIVNQKVYLLVPYKIVSVTKCEVHTSRRSFLFPTASLDAEVPVWWFWGFRWCASCSWTFDACSRAVPGGSEWFWVVPGGSGWFRVVSYYLCWIT